MFEDGVEAAGDPWHASVAELLACEPDVRGAALAGSTPGPEVLQALAAFDPATLDPCEQVDHLIAWERCAAWVAAGQARVLAALAEGPRPDLPPAVAGLEEEVLRGEIGAALRVSPQAAYSRLEVAAALAGPLAKTGAALAAGAISYLQAMVIAEEVKPLSVEVAQAVQDRVLGPAGRDTVGRLRSRVRRAVLDADPDIAELRHATAKAERRVERWVLDDGMAAVHAVLSADAAATVYTALDALARKDAASSAGGLDAARADALVELCRLALGEPGLPRGHGQRPHVQVTVDLPTLLGLADHPGELEGYGPVPASMARALAADGRWRRLVTDPVTGGLLDYARRTYLAPRALQDFLIARDRTCGFPGCPRAARRCDCDHAEPFDQGGTTSPSNCGMLCRRHHRLKTHTRWRLTRQPDGTTTWTTPAGHSYTTRPDGYRPDG